MLLAAALRRVRAMDVTDSSSHEEFILSMPTVVVLEGDQTGQELLLEALRVLDRSVVDVNSSSTVTIFRSSAGAKPKTASCSRRRMRS